MEIIVAVFVATTGFIAVTVIGARMFRGQGYTDKDAVEDLRSNIAASQRIRKEEIKVNPWRMNGN